MHLNTIIRLLLGTLEPTDGQSAQLSILSVSPTFLPVLLELMLHISSHWGIPTRVFIAINRRFYYFLKNLRVLLYYHFLSCPTQFNRSLILSLFQSCLSFPLKLLLRLFATSVIFQKVSKIIWRHFFSPQMVKWWRFTVIVASKSK